MSAYTTQKKLFSKKKPIINLLPLPVDQLAKSCNASVNTSPNWFLLKRRITNISQIKTGPQYASEPKRPDHQKAIINPVNNRNSCFCFAKCICFFITRKSGNIFGIQIGKFDKLSFNLLLSFANNEGRS